MSEIKNVDQFLDGITKDGKKLSPKERTEFLIELEKALFASSELAKIHFNTQVYNKIENGVTTRGEHSEGVARVAARLAETSIMRTNKTVDKESIKNSALLALCFGYMHDLGHTPFGHDGEGALGEEMERFKADDAYFKSREQQLGTDYTDKTDWKEKDGKKERVGTMCYEHNETSAIIGSNFLTNFLKERGLKINESSMQYVKTAILAHSTSRVKKDPNGIEQQAVRLADKVAYIPQDLGDLLKQGVIDKELITEDELKLIGLNQVKLEDFENLEKSGFAGLTEAERKNFERVAKGSTEEKQKAIRYLNDKRQVLLINIKKFGTGELNPAAQKEINDRINEHIYAMQEAIAGQLVTENGEFKGQKEDFDKLTKFIKEAKTDDNTKVKTYGYKKDDKFIVPNEKESKGIELVESLNSAIKDFDDVKLGSKNDMTAEVAKQKLDEATAKLKTFLTSKEGYGMNETVATLWITKHKYQDSFIADKLHVNGNRNRQSNATVQQNQTLAEVNKRNDNGWKMKVTFQYFFSNQDQIPQDFKNKYPSDKFTSQQLVSAYIASFTNEGLESLYQNLKDKKAVISREDAIKNLFPGMNQKEVNEKITAIKKSIKKESNDKIKVSENDILEVLYETNTGNTIVGNKNIPAHEQTDKINEHASRQFNNLKESSIKLSTEKVSAIDIQNIIEEANKKNKEQIDFHLLQAAQTQSIGQSQYGAY